MLVVCRIVFELLSKYALLHKCFKTGRDKWWQRVSNECVSTSGHSLTLLSHSRTTLGPATLDVCTVKNRKTKHCALYARVMHDPLDNSVISAEIICHRASDTHTHCVCFLIVILHKIFTAD